MPAQSSLTSDEKIKIKNAIPASSNKIFSAAVARIYYAYPDPHHWSYTGLQGAVVLSKDNIRNSLNFKLVDVDGTRGVIWEHELYNAFELNQDRGFFHSFPGDECMIGFVYADEPEAKTFFKKVNSKKELAAAVRKPSKSKKKQSISKGKIDKSMISGPQAGSFQHLAHMGYDADTGFSSKGIDPSWLALLENLEGKGISREVIAKEMDFIKTFVGHNQDAPKKKSKPPPPPAPNRRSQVPNGGLTKPPSPRLAPVRTSQPPPAPQRQPQPPPAPQRQSQPPPPALQRTQPTPPPAPQRAQPTPPPAPQRAQPTPPPAPQRTQPPSPPRGAGPSSIPSPQPGRADLLASIRSSGGVGSLRKSENSSPPPRSSASTGAAVAAEAASGGGSDLTSALAAALMERNKRLGDSDSEEEDDDDEWD
ncbi:hypothetical protein AN958_02022 [Leucoagaricus sp. SymC.cos]|nr:hypothetical protein AN958_02022 [Leucoagaricus sp. SymC.cos]